MTVRLAFSIAIQCDPDILLIDEVLAVGGFVASGDK
jgi:ABC-type polysaccharide/polyol phosphate transport system ATPase subunit